jgi:phosphatidate cytidylyltransferase
MKPSPPARRFDWSNLVVRALSATVLIPLTLGAVWWDGVGLLLLVAVGVALLANEWGEMIAPAKPKRVALAVGVAVLAAVFCAWLPHFASAWALVVVGAAVAGWASRGSAAKAVDGAYGVVYLAPPCLALLWLRAMPEGREWTVILFAVTWSTDILAFAIGNLLKGPKLWPRFSPNKTWAGLIGGLVGAMLSAMALAAALKVDLGPLGAAVVGLAAGMATMAGDLWESMLKRRFGVKDSGSLIPGHGGLLDRVDGLMFAAVVVAVVRLFDYWGTGR